MTPAEIWQGGKIVNKITGTREHQGKLDGKKVRVKNEESGCRILPEDDGRGRYLSNGDSVTLDGGEILRSVRK